LQAEYQHLGRQLRRWLLGGTGLLLALPLLWQLLPSTRQLVPVPTRGYRWRQAGTVQDSGTTWVWALADSAGQARLLLSRNRGRTWLTRHLGVPAAQARALALGWGSPWRGVLLGQKGELRMLPDVRRNPQLGEVMRSPLIKGTSQAISVDRSGQQVVFTDSLGILKSLDAGRSWHRWNTPWPITQVLFEPVGRRFFVISPKGIGRQTEANSLNWEIVTATEATAPVLYAAFSGSSLFIIYQNGKAALVSDESQPGGAQVLGNYRVFSGLAQRPVALVGWPGARPQADTTAAIATDSALVFVKAAASGLIQRLRLKALAPPLSQQSPPASTSQPPLPANDKAQAALVARAEAAAKDSVFQSRKQSRPTKGTTSPATSPTSSPVQQSPIDQRAVGKRKY
jgi:hypothetical protein